MTKLRFTDEVEIDTSGPLRTMRIGVEWYVVGEGYLEFSGTGEEGRKEAEETLQEILENTDESI